MSTPVVGDSGQLPQPSPNAQWYDETIERYSNPGLFARKNAQEQTPTLQEQTSLASPSGGKDIELEVHLLKERPFWSKIFIFWTFRLADMEENNEGGQNLVIMLAFDTWTGLIQISENNASKVDEIQKPIVGGSWTTMTDFGRLDIKVVPFWTGYQYELHHEGKKAYEFFA